LIAGKARKLSGGTHERRSKKKVRQAFNQSRIAVYHDEKRQEAFLRATAGVLRIAQITREDNRFTSIAGASLSFDWRDFFANCSNA